MVRIPVDSKWLRLLLCIALASCITLAVYFFSGYSQGYACGIEGSVMVRPQQPAAVNSLETCPGASIVIRDAATHKIVTTLKADSNGNFRVRLVPGKYIVEVVSKEDGACLYGEAPAQEVGGDDTTRLTVFVKSRPEAK